MCKEQCGPRYIQYSTVAVRLASQCSYCCAIRTILSVHNGGDFTYTVASYAVVTVGGIHSSKLSPPIVSKCIDDLIFSALVVRGVCTYWYYSLDCDLVRMLAKL